jgi:Predicted transcriptional regulator
MTDRRTDSLVLLPTVIERTGMSQSTIYRRMAAGLFPRSVKISQNCVAWYLSDIADFIESPTDYRAE